MIYTITLNPAIDFFIELQDDIQFEEVNRGKNEIFKPAGKGLNVSKVLKLFAIPSYVIAVLGGFTGDYIKQSFEKDSLIHLIPIHVEGNNRINVKAYHGTNTIAINGEGPCANDDTKQEILSLLKKLTPEDYVVVSGSMMKGFDEAFLVSLAKQIHHKNARLVLDMEQISLELLKECKPFLIKPNLYELGLLFGKDIQQENVIEYLHRLYELGVQNILLSLGKDGAILCDGKYLKLNQPNTDLVNKVGAGDAMLAAFVGCLSQGMTKEEALKYAGAAGNAVASQIEDISIEDIDRQYLFMSIL